MKRNRGLNVFYILYIVYNYKTISSGNHYLYVRYQTNGENEMKHLISAKFTGL